MKDKLATLGIAAAMMEAISPRPSRKRKPKPSGMILPDKVYKKRQAKAKAQKASRKANRA